MPNLRIDHTIIAMVVLGHGVCLGSIQHFHYGMVDCGIITINDTFIDILLDYGTITIAEASTLSMDISWSLSGHGMSLVSLYFNWEI